MKVKLGKLDSILNQALDLLKDLSGTLVILALVSAGVLLSLKAPELHNKYIRSSVGSKVYKIRDRDSGGGGTGFAITAPSGQSYILTNDHVCGVSKDGKTVYVSDDQGNGLRRNIVAHDGNSDLCLIEAPPGVSGLSVARHAPHLGDEVTVVGHPRLLPLAVKTGEMIGYEDIMIAMGPIAVLNPDTGDWEQIDPAKGGVLPEQCALNKNKVVETDLDLFFVVLRVKFCTLNVKQAYITTAQIFPGNSGSPLVNFWGNVTGVIFASDSTNWARVVSHHDVVDFLKNY